MRAIATTLCVLVFAGGPSVAAAQALVPGPTEAGHDPALLDRAETWVRLQQGILSVPFGFGLEANVSDPADIAAIEAFVASGERDVLSATGTHPYELVDRFWEFEDVGMFGGVQAAGDAFRYMVLRDSGAPADVLDAARAALVRAADGLHWQAQITGVPGVVARGIGRRTSLPGEPPIPGTLPTFLPLFDSGGAAQPAEKQPTFREDNSGELPELFWYDDCSKDQLDGYVFALGAMYDAMNGDPSFDVALLTRLSQDALELGLSLMERRDVGGGDMADLTIIDADGRLTTHHAMSAEEATEGSVVPRPINGFNAALGLGIVRTLYHVTGDERLGRFYYEELIGRRNYFRPVEQTLSAMYIGTATNYSNVNMAFVGLYGVLRYETDDAVWNRARAVLEDVLYAPGRDREPRGAKNPFFDLMYAAFRPGGSADATGRSAVSDALESLGEHPPAPVWNPRVEHCDAAEVASLDCTADDGSPMPLAATRGHNDVVVAVDPLPMRLRPPSNFVHRSDPHQVNGGGSDRLNPAGSMHAAYWLGRLMLGGDADNRTTDLRAAYPTDTPTPDAGTSPDAGPGGEPDAGCGCRVGATSDAPLGVLVVLGAFLAFRRRRRR